jgi:beta-glucosidase
MNKTAFSDQFVFGVATSAYQVEGGIENDWTAWERAGKLKDKTVRCGRASGHWETFFDDISLLKQLNVTSYRLSIEWARVEPRQNQFDASAVDGYRKRLEALVQHGITPIVTFSHFTHPPWFHESTPWHEPSSLVAWTRFVKVCAQMISGLGVMVTTLNEPNVLLLGGYLSAAIPPGINDGKKGFAAYANMARAHVIARQAVKEISPNTPVGIAHNCISFAPSRWWNPLDQAADRIATQAYNFAFYDALHTGTLKVSIPGMISGKESIEGGQDSMDFIGVNYYTRAHLKFIFKPPFLEFEYFDRAKHGLTDIGWEIYPEGLGQILRQLKRYRLPIWITENGLDDRSDDKRVLYTKKYLSEVLSAISDGVDVRGYLHWSLMDNFEWLEGFEPRFGLYRVDYQTMERTLTKGGSYFAQVAKTRVLSF